MECEVAHADAPAPSGERASVRAGGRLYMAEELHQWACTQQHERQIWLVDEIQRPNISARTGKKLLLEDCWL